MKMMVAAVIILLFLGVTGSFLWGSSTQGAGDSSPKPFADLDPNTFQRLSLQKDPKPVILDVRTAEEYAEGHIAQAILLDFFGNGFTKELSQLDKDQTYLVYCRSGNRSGQTLSQMKRLGFKTAYHMAGGIIRWSAAGLPVETRP